MITQLKLKSLLRYIPESGAFEWLEGGGGCTPMPTGYRRLRRHGIEEYAHRLAFLYMEGYIPDCVDHINGDPSDNRWANLRPCSHKENMRNRGAQRNSKSGVKGVSWDKVKKKWRVQVTAGGSRFSRRFDNLELAELVAIEARELLHGKFAWVV